MTEMIGGVGDNRWRKEEEMQLRSCGDGGRWHEEFVRMERRRVGVGSKLDERERKVRPF